MFNTLQIELDHLVKRSAVEKSQYLGESKRCCDCPDEWCTNPFSGKKRDSTLVEVTILQQFLITGALLDSFAAGLGAPYRGRRAGTGQRMQADGPKIAVAAAEPGFDNKVKANLIERAAAQRVVKTAQETTEKARPDDA